MKVFRVWVDKYDYDTYDSFICVANSEEEIRKRISIDKYNNRVIIMNNANGYEYSVTFSEFQGEIHIKEVNVDVAEPYIVCSSYHAG